nr:MAG TPA: hypothetical protein [Caudoviricetes sp.]
MKRKTKKYKIIGIFFKFCYNLITIKGDIL